MRPCLAQAAPSHRLSVAGILRQTHLWNIRYFSKGELGLPVSLMALHNLPSTAWQSAMLPPKVLPLSLHMGSYLRSSLMALPALPSIPHYFHSGVFPNKILEYLISRWCPLFEGPELTQLPSSFLVWVGDFAQLWVSYFLTGLLNELDSTEIKLILSNHCRPANRPHGPIFLSMDRILGGFYIS